MTEHDDEPIGRPMRWYQKLPVAPPSARLIESIRAAAREADTETANQKRFQAYYSALPVAPPSEDLQARIRAAVRRELPAALQSIGKSSKPVRRAWYSGLALAASVVVVVAMMVVMFNSTIQDDPWAPVDLRGADTVPAAELNASHTPAQWLAEIRRLENTGALSAAHELFARFKQSFPHHPATLKNDWHD